MRTYGIFGMVALIGAGVALITLLGISPLCEPGDEIDWYGL